jgi:hypothetical protein
MSHDISNLLTLMCCLTSQKSKDVMCKKGKEIPLQAWTGPEGSRRIRPPDFKRIGT